MLRLSLLMTAFLMGFGACGTHSVQVPEAPCLEVDDPALRLSLEPRALIELGDGVEALLDRLPEAERLGMRWRSLLADFKAVIPPPIVALTSLSRGQIKFSLTGAGGRGRLRKLTSMSTHRASSPLREGRLQGTLCLRFKERADLSRWLRTLPSNWRLSSIERSHHHPSMERGPQGGSRWRLTPDDQRWFAEFLILGQSISAWVSEAIG